jgi:HAD superfamily hydrolase (TIGR01509 family)
MAIRQLIFDCDGVLVDSEILATRIALDMLKPFGYAKDEITFASTFSGLQTVKILDILREEEGLAIPPGFDAELWKAFEKAFETELAPVPGMPELITSLPRIPKNVVSNGHGAHVKRSLKITGLEAHFGEEIFGIERVERGKPHPDLYLLAQWRLQRSREDILVIEDSAFGVEAAKAAGLRVIGFTGASHLTDAHAEKLRASGADFTATSATDLDELLKELL